MLSNLDRRNKDLIDRFHVVLRSDKDYDVKSIYKEVGDEFYLSGTRVQAIINNFYKDFITADMIVFAFSLNGKLSKQIEGFSRKFDVCQRESRLILRYIVNMISHEKGYQR